MHTYATGARTPPAGGRTEAAHPILKGNLDTNTLSPRVLSSPREKAPVPGLMAAQSCSSGQGEAWGSGPSELRPPTNQFPQLRTAGGSLARPGKHGGGELNENPTLNEHLSPRAEARTGGKGLRAVGSVKPHRVLDSLGIISASELELSSHKGRGWHCQGSQKSRGLGRGMSLLWEQTNSPGGPKGLRSSRPEI